ncbi:MAG: hypothetical protein KGR98_01530 [Verrucomicrobia bacterium]|nr:hypothetical protein [Verrucomicrobiota bacterium]
MNNDEGSAATMQLGRRIANVDEGAERREEKPSSLRRAEATRTMSFIFIVLRNLTGLR